MEKKKNHIQITTLKIAANGGAENFRKNVLPKLNAICKKAGLGDLFLIVVTQKLYHFDEKYITDAHVSYSFAGLMTDSRYEVPGSAPYSEMVDRLPEEWEIMKQLKIPYIVTTQAGWDDTPRTLGHGNNTPWVRTDNNVKLFERTLREGKNNVASSFPFFIIEAWNEWGEGSFIEPGEKFKFTQLDAIRNVFAPSAEKNKWARPTKKQILKYSVLKGKELAAAHAKEKENPPPVPKRHTWSTDVVNDPKQCTGKVIDTIHLNNSLIKKHIIRTDGVEILSFKNNKLYCKIIGNDPKILINGQWGKFAGIAGIKLKVVYKGTAQNRAQLFWETSDSPLNEKNSRVYPWFYDEKPHVYFIKFKKNYARIGNLNAIRIDFPASRGSIAEIEWIKIIRY
ncbi:glycoside hydrolase family 99-like domain-containing protein [bacterium]|nr:glycoside hydrolase family 99-like domain-containing protein [bacterium]